jgi:acyl carrier protein
MSRDEISTRVTAIVSEITKRPAASLNENALLISGGLVDSFHLVDLAMRVEDDFGVVIADTELDGQTFDSLGSLVDLIASRR